MFVIQSIGQSRCEESTESYLQLKNNEATLRLYHDQLFQDFIYWRD